MGLEAQTDKDQIVKGVHTAAFTATSELLTVLLDDKKLSAEEQLLSESQRVKVQEVRIMLQEALKKVSVI